MYITNYSSNRGIVLMNDLLVEPEGFFNHIRRYTASVASTLVYGQRGSTFDSFWAHVSNTQYSHHSG